MLSRYTQPQGALEINWGNPIAAKLCAIALPCDGGTINFSRDKPVDAFGLSNGPDINVKAGSTGLGVGRDPSTPTTNTLRLNAVPNRTDTGWEEPSSQATWLAVIYRAGNNAGNSPIFSNGSPTASPYDSWAILDKNGIGNLSISISVNGAYKEVVATDVLQSNSNHVVAGRYDGTKLDAFLDGNLIGSPVACSGNISYPNSPDRGPAIGNFWDYTGSQRAFNGRIFMAILSDEALSDDEIKSLSENPWQIFKGSGPNLFKPQGFGPIDHVTEGSPEGPGADTTGSASHRPTNVEHETGGAPKGFQAAITGVAERDRLHITLGDPRGFTSTVEGTSTRYRMHPVTGAVVADYATVIGASESSSPAGVHECEGIVVASEAIVVGTALNFSKLTSSGAVNGYQSTVTGAAKNVKKHSTNGAPIGKSSQVIGTAARQDPVLDHGTFGEVDGHTSTVTGNAVNQGTMTLTPADISAIVAALQAAILPVNIVKVNDVDVIGSGQSGDTWGPV